MVLSACSGFLEFKGKLVPAGDEPVELAFSSWEDAILIEAEINGQTGVFLFDNGFSNSAVSPEFAQRANIVFDGTSNTTDINNQKREIPKARVGQVLIEGQTFVNTWFYLLDTKVFAPCIQLDGIVGASIINLVNWEIDYAARRIRLSSKPFHAEGHRMDVEVSQNNSSFTTIGINNINVRAKIDFGKVSDELTLSLENTSEYFTGFEAIEYDGIKSLSANGLGSPATFYRLADKVPIEANGVVLPAASKTSLVGNLKYDGYLGASYFRNYEKVIINSTNKEYILSGPGHRDSPSFGNEKAYGLTVYHVDGTWQVIQRNRRDPLVRDTALPAEVLLLDDEPASRFEGVCDYKDYLDTKLEHEEALVLMLKDGRKIELPFRKPATIQLD